MKNSGRQTVLCRPTYQIKFAAFSNLFNLKGADKMNIAICDDQKSYNEKLSGMLRNYLKRKNIDDFDISTFTSGRKLSETHKKGMYDFIFLDVQMPNFSGDQTAKQIRDIDLTVDIIFVTNMKDQSLMGYNYNAKGFLIKEIEQEQLDKLMDRLLFEMHHRDDIGMFSVKQKFDKGTVHLRLSEILYFQSYDKDITVSTQDASFEFRGQLSVLESKYNEKGFLRISRSVLVNTLHVFMHFGDIIAMKTGEQFSISKKYRTTVAKAIGLKG